MICAQDIFEAYGLHHTIPGFSNLTFTPAGLSRTLEVVALVNQDNGCVLRAWLGIVGGSCSSQQAPFNPSYSCASQFEHA